MLTGACGLCAATFAFTRYRAPRDQNPLRAGIIPYSIQNATVWAARCCMKLTQKCAQSEIGTTRAVACTARAASNVSSNLPGTESGRAIRA